MWEAGIVKRAGAAAAARRVQGSYWSAAKREYETGGLDHRAGRRLTCGRRRFQKLRPQH
jgi:hypothetical protein